MCKTRTETMKLKKDKKYSIQIVPTIQLKQFYSNTDMKVSTLDIQNYSLGESLLTNYKSVSRIF